MGIEYPELGLKSILKFGKHKGESIEEVIESDPLWLDWAVGEIDSFVLDAEATDLLDDAVNDHLEDFDSWKGKY